MLLILKRVSIGSSGNNVSGLVSVVHRLKEQDLIEVTFQSGEKTQFSSNSSIPISVVPAESDSLIRDKAFNKCTGKKNKTSPFSCVHSKKKSNVFEFNEEYSDDSEYTSGSESIREPNRFLKRQRSTEETKVNHRAAFDDIDNKSKITNLQKQNKLPRYKLSRQKRLNSRKQKRDKSKEDPKDKLRKEERNPALAINNTDSFSLNIF